MRRILSNALLAVWTAVWVAFWVVAFLLYAIVGGFGGSKRARHWPKTLGYDPGFDPGIDRAIIRECNYFAPDKYCWNRLDGVCVALDGKPCKWLDEVVRPLAPYGYIVRKDKP